MQMSNTDEQLDQLDSELWSPPPEYFKPHSSAIQYPRTGGLIDIDTQKPVSPERFNGKGERTAVRGLPKK
jgi:DNA polymerase IIIc chi subunit